MTALSEAAVRSFLLEKYAAPLKAQGIAPDAVGDDFDFFQKGIIDSFGILEMIGSVEEQFGLSLDFEEVDPEQITTLGPLCRFVAAQAAA